MTWLDELSLDYYERRTEILRNEIMMQEIKDPASAPGLKFDQGKAPVVEGCLQRFPRAIAAVAKVSEYGKKKYGSYGDWETVPDAFNRYTNAMGRHLLSDRNGCIDPESGLLEIAMTAWNAIARLELFLKERENGETK